MGETGRFTLTGKGLRGNLERERGKWERANGISDSCFWEKVRTELLESIRPF